MKKDHSELELIGNTKEGHLQSIHLRITVPNLVRTSSDLNSRHEEPQQMKSENFACLSAYLHSQNLSHATMTSQIELKSTSSKTNPPNKSKLFNLIKKQIKNRFWENR